MGVTPTDVMSPAGWVDTITNSGASIRWVASSPIAAGTSVTGFIFDSTMTPTQFMGTFAGPGLGMGDPITTATIYIAAPFGDPGAHTDHRDGSGGCRYPGAQHVVACRESPWGFWHLPPELPGSGSSPFNVSFAFLSGSGVWGIGGGRSRWG